MIRHAIRSCPRSPTKWLEVPEPLPRVVEAFAKSARRRLCGQMGSRRGWKSQAMWLPRASAAYQVNEGMVVKGGYGVYYDSLNATAILPNQLGFSTVTAVQSSNDFGQTWASGNPRAGISPLVDPFPRRADGTRFVTPAGTSLGGDFVAGQALSYGNLDREHARLQRWRAGVQRELGRNMAIEVAYVGTYSDNVDLTVLRTFSCAVGTTQTLATRRSIPKHQTFRPVSSSETDGAPHSNPALTTSSRAGVVHEPDDSNNPAASVPHMT